jgi:hypothetical protein
MDKEEMRMAVIFFGSMILAIFPTWKLWPAIKKKLGKSRFGSIILGAKTPHGGLVYLVYTLIWGAIMGSLFLIILLGEACMRCGL